MMSTVSKPTVCRSRRVTAGPAHGDRAPSRVCLLVGPNHHLESGGVDEGDVTAVDHEAACPVTQQVHSGVVEFRSLHRIQFSTDADHSDVTDDFRTELHRSTQGLEVKGCDLFGFRSSRTADFYYSGRSTCASLQVELSLRRKLAELVDPHPCGDGDRHHVDDLDRSLADDVTAEDGARVTADDELAEPCRPAVDDRPCCEGQTSCLRPSFPRRRGACRRRMRPTAPAARHRTRPARGNRA